MHDPSLPLLPQPCFAQALTSSLTARLSRGDTTDAQPITTGDWSEIQHEKALAAVLPVSALSAARLVAVSERDAIMLAAKKRIEELEQQARRNREQRQVLNREVERLKQENGGLRAGRDDDGRGEAAKEETAELREENQRMREEFEGMTE